MDTLVGVHVDAWDYLTFAAMFIIVAAGLTVVVLILGLPGRIAIARKPCLKQMRLSYPPSASTS